MKVKSSATCPPSITHNTSFTEPHLMKIKITVAAALAALAAPSFAQSNVTLYGVADMFYQYADGANSLSRAQSGGLAGSRFGLRGSEDLGGGLRANFTLEGGVNLDDGTSGQGGAMFGRQAHVGLSGSFGSVSLGRQYTALYAATNDHSLFTSAPAGPSTALIGGFGGGYELVRGASATGVPPQAGATGNGGPVRVNNSIKYESPSLAGFKLGPSTAWVKSRAPRATTRSWKPRRATPAMALT
jgi:predicted porin